MLSLSDLDRCFQESARGHVVMQAGGWSKAMVCGVDGDCFALRTAGSEMFWFQHAARCPIVALWWLIHMDTRSIAHLR